MNYAKYTKSAIGHLAMHFERGKDRDGNYIKFGNQNIDTDLSWLNYNLAPAHNQVQFIQDRLQEVYCLNRKDVNVMCSWVVTAPKDLDPNDCETFFLNSYEFFEQKYGRENVVSAYVHMDEVTPHMHFAFIPVVQDQKRGLKVSAKECVGKIDLQSMHQEMELYQKVHGLEVKLLNDLTRDGNKSIEELKRGTAIQELTQTKQELKEIEADVELNEKRFNLMVDKMQEVSNAYESVIAELSELRRERGQLLAKDEIEALSEPKKSLFGKEQEYVSIPTDTYVKLRNTALKVDTAEKTMQQAKEIEYNAKELDEACWEKVRELQDEEASLEQKKENAQRWLNQEQRKLDERKEYLDSVQKKFEKIIDAFEQVIAEHNPYDNREMLDEVGRMSEYKSPEKIELERERAREELEWDFEL